MNKHRDLSVVEKIDVLTKYDEIPQTSDKQHVSWSSTYVSQSILGRMLKSRQEIENASLENENLNRKRKRISKEEEVKETLKQWFTKVRENYAPPPELQDHHCAKMPRISRKKNGQKWICGNRRLVSSIEDMENMQGETDHASTRSWILSE